jgi:L-lactate dehydrogenase (cytochrome)
MKLSEALGLVRVRRVELSHDRRVLARCHDLDDMRREARRRLPLSVFDYIEGGADEELSLSGNPAAFRRWSFRPQVFRDVSEPDLQVSLLGGDLPAPLGLAPTGYTRMIHPAGEIAVARAAASRQLPYGLSTVGTVTIDDLAATGHRNLWFQLYVPRDRKLMHELIDRAAAAGFRALEVSADTPVAGHRTRDLRAGLTIPPSLSARTILDLAAHPGYWTAMLRHPALEFASLPSPGTPGGATIADISSLFDPQLTWDDLAEIRAHWSRPLLVKGPLGPADAARAVSAGVDGIHLSNHGGRQLDRCVPAIGLVRPVREAVGPDIAIVLDSGIRHGADVAVSIARGADLCMIGRGYLYGLAAAGQPGVEHVIDLLISQLRRTMQLLGVTTPAELRRCGDQLVVPGDSSVGLPR